MKRLTSLFLSVVFLALPCSRANWGSVITGSPPAAVAALNAVSFDATAWVVKSTDLTGLSDGKAGTTSFWFKTTSASTGTIHAASGGYFVVQVNDIGRVLIIGYNAAATKILQLRSNNSGFNNGAWHHAMASWDLATATAYFYVDGVSDFEASPILTNDTIDYVRGAWMLGSESNSSKVTGYIGSMSEVWFTNTAYDFSSGTERAKFISGGNPVSPLPSGLLYVSSAAASYTTNSGSGGNFTTITNTIADVAPPP